MTSTENTSDVTLQTMSEDECRSALVNHAFGRLAVVMDDGPVIFAVNYAYVENAIVIRTGTGSKLASAPLTKVAFEIDYVHPSHVSGWSVVARGPAFDISTAIDEMSQGLRMLPLHSWIPGHKPYVLKINVKELTGRTFSTSAMSFVDDRKNACYLLHEKVSKATHSHVHDDEVGT
jgi:nitroimidazol reductase NimA-like FMN-containing flavoprotein (pyridoxamine 5'-phosphate oxidase superfamily)